MGIIKMSNGFYTFSDDHFKNMRKQDLLKYIRTIEKNWQNSLITNDIQYNNYKRLSADERNKTIEYVIKCIKSKSEDWEFDLTNLFDYIDFIYELDKITKELKLNDETLLKKQNDCIDAFVNALIPRLTDAIYPKDVESMTNLINDVAREFKEARNDN